jgi:hypothetical protein
VGIYGSACSATAGESGDDLDTTGAEIDDASLIAEDMQLATTIKAGALFYAPEDTLDLNDELGKTDTDAGRAELARRIEDLYARDDRYQSVAATASSEPGNTLRVTQRAETDVGTFELTQEEDSGVMRVVKTS